jgi:hypothetical protein
MLTQLHVDFLSAHSTLLRALFAGASPIHLIDPARHTIASLPRILSSSSAERPHILLPVPDPYSFRFLAHWCYFRDFRYVTARPRRRDAFTHKSAGISVTTSPAVSFRGKESPGTYVISGD